MDVTGLARLVDRLHAARGPRAAHRLVLRAECAAGLRRPRLALYDHALHLVGGGQKYGCLLLAALRDRWDLTLVANRPIDVGRLAAWYGADLAGVGVEVVPLPFFDGRGLAQPDPALAAAAGDNPFLPVSETSRRYDLFVNNSMNELVRPLSAMAAAVCHFPERRPAGEFHMHEYRPLIVNSDYTRDWLRRRWGLTADRLVHPPVAGGPPPPAAERRPMVLSVARFERAGSKRQLEMARAFRRLRAAFPGATAGWRLVLAGGVEEGGNDYLRRVEAVAADAGGTVELRTNVSGEELQRLYREASIFWHLCGLGARDPALREHFGMTVAEAMRYGLPAVVYDGGGLREIVDDGATGFRVGSSAELLERTLDLVLEPERRRVLGGTAAAAAARFGIERFEAEVRGVFDGLLADYTGGLEADLERLRHEL